MTKKWSFGEERKGARWLQGMKVAFGILLVIALVGLSLPRTVNAVYPDEIGVIDWALENVGKVHSLGFAEPADTKRIFVGTASNTVAALNYNGSLAWRQVLPDNFELNSLIHKGKRLVSVANGGAHLALWRATDGALIWDALQPKPQPECSKVDVELLSKDIDGDGVFDVAVLVSGELQTRSGASGELIRSVSVGCGASALVVSEGSFFVIGIDQGKLTVQTVSFEGTLQTTNIRTSGGASLVSFITLGTTHVVALDNSNTLHLLRLSSQSFSHSASLKQILPSSVVLNQVRLESDRSQTSFFVRVSATETAALTLENGGSLKLLHVFRHEPDRVTAATAEGRKEGLALIHVGKTSTQIQLLTVASQGLESLETFVVPALDSAVHGPAVKAFVEVVSKPAGGFVHLVSIVTEDHALSFVRNDQLSWTRDEALASLTNAEIVDPPADLAEQSLLETEFKTIGHVSMFHQFYQQLHAQLLRLISSVPQDLNSLQRLLLDLRLHESSEESDPKSLKKDRFGLKKIIIAYSAEAGSVFGIHSTNGEIFWRRHFASSLSIRALHFLRSAAHYPPEVLLVLSEPSTGSTHFVALNALTGDTLKTSKLAVEYQQSFTLPYLSNDEKILLVIDTQNVAHLVPDDVHTRPTFRDHAQSTFFYHVGKDSIRGFGFGKEDLKPFQRWSVAFPNSEIYYALRHPREVVQSPIRSFAEQGVVSKYINLNTMAYATVTPTSTLESVLDVYILDTVTGRTVYHISHSGARGPVHLAISENWVVYHFFNQKLNRYQTTVAEFFLEEINWNTTSFTSFSEQPIRALVQSFHFNSDITAMGLTVTARGITTKEVLVATRAGQIVGLNKNRILDPRRPPKEKITPLEREEGLQPYDPNVVLFPDAYHSYNRAVVGVKRFASAPALLESTSLVLAFGGVDVYYTRVQPSKGYDLLSPEFNSGMLVVTCAALLIATSVSAWLSKQKDLRNAWR